jgi:cytochrome c peroxidase
MKKLLYIVFASILFVSCKDDENPSPSQAFTGFVQPSTFPNPLYKFENNEVTEAGFALGKKLFYDGKLSRDGSISCASCHLQSAAFSHIDHPVSHGIDDLLGTRNAPAIQNMAWTPFFFWDGGVFDLDLFSLSPIQNPVEMDESIPNVLQKLRQDPAYPMMFKKAFGSDSITSTGMLQALSQFMCMLVSSNSRYDQYIAGNFSALNEAEINGLTIFNQHCSRCHPAPLFTDNAFHDNGLSKTNDKGRYFVTVQNEDMYKFKTPSLRNVEKTYPYMHDGRLFSLDQVINHYTSNIANSQNVDTGLVGGITLTATEKSNLVLFLKTLTDDSFLRDPRFAE